LGNASRPALTLRLLSAAVLAPLALATLWLGPPYFSVLVMLVASLMAWEWAGLLEGARPRARGLVMIGLALLAVGAAALGQWPLALVLAVAGALATALLPPRQAPASAAWAACGLLWILLGSIAALWLRAGPEGRPLLLWLFFLVWATDSAAYFVGRAVGGPRLAPRWSPKKTWSGALGGLAGALLVALAAEHLLGLPLLSRLLWATLVLSAAAQAGDLAESAAKRRFGAKDSSGLIPGHGGFLDRLDGLLAALLAAALAALAGAPLLRAE